MKTDPIALKFNQINIIALSALGLFYNHWLIGLSAFIMLLGTAWPKLALFKQLFTKLVRPLLRLEPQFIDDDPRAHNFAQGVGGIFLSLAGLSYLGDLPVLGAVLTLLVIALAALNLSTGYCVGCQMYYYYKMLRYRLGRV